MLNLLTCNNTVHFFINIISICLKYKIEEQGFLSVDLSDWLVGWLDVGKGNLQGEGGYFIFSLNIGFD